MERGHDLSATGDSGKGMTSSWVRLVDFQWKISISPDRRKRSRPLFLPVYMHTSIVRSNRERSRSELPMAKRDQEQTSLGLFSQ